MAKERPDAAQGGETFGKRMLHGVVHTANRATGNYFTRRKVRVLVDGTDAKSVPELLRRARRGEAVVATLSEMVANGGALGANAAHMIGKLAEEGLDCSAAVGPLTEILYYGSEVEKSMAAHALIRIRDRDALSILLAAFGNPDRKVRMAVEVIVSLGRAALEDEARKPDPEISALSRKLLDRIPEQGK
ncbi:MAG: hypothetical protein PHD43_23205 [Methylococcales bacterium]|nr:hypothetical protein [Candidatus ainarchaeum sp.]MDD5096732.1 hypothetical protein [Candidatus ainarchaeum sp.]MDD5323457.1 hypothetical protein [Methylococcales bacterium]